MSINEDKTVGADKAETQAALAWQLADPDAPTEYLGRTWRETAYLALKVTGGLVAVALVAFAALAGFKSLFGQHADAPMVVKQTVTVTADPPPPEFPVCYGGSGCLPDENDGAFFKELKLYQIPQSDDPGNFPILVGAGRAVCEELHNGESPGDTVEKTERLRGYTEKASIKFYITSQTFLCPDTQKR